MRRVRVSVGEVVATDRLLVAVAVGGLGACQTALWLNVLDITFGAAATNYVAVLLLSLGSVGFMFVRLMMPRN